MDGHTRRDVLKVAGVAGAAALLVGESGSAEAASIVSHRSTTGVIIPPRGASFMNFSFDTPEPSLRFAGLCERDQVLYGHGWSPGGRG